MLPHVANSIIRKPFPIPSRGYEQRALPENANRTKAHLRLISFGGKWVGTRGAGAGHKGDGARWRVEDRQVQARDHRAGGTSVCSTENLYHLLLRTADVGAPNILPQIVTGKIQFECPERAEMHFKRWRTDFPWGTDPHLRIGASHSTYSQLWKLMQIRGL